MACPDENQLIAFVGDGRAGASDVERHVQSCNECRQLCRALSTHAPSDTVGDAVESLLQPQMPRAVGTQVPSLRGNAALLPIS